MENFEILYKVLDESATLIKDCLHNSYIDSLFITSRNILENTCVVDLPSSVVEELKECYLKLDGVEMNRDEIREAISFATLKALKEDNIQNSEYTPSALALIVSFITSKIYKSRDHLAVLDPVVGTANLLTAVLNYLKVKSVDVYGFDIVSSSIKLAQVQTDMQGYVANFVIEDFIKSNITGFDLAVFDTPLYLYDDEYFPHVLVDKLSEALVDDAYAVGFIPNDFFEAASKRKEQILEKFDLVGLIALGKSLFVDERLRKSIVILKKKGVIEIDDLLVCELPDLKDKANFQKMMRKVEKYFD